MCAPLPLLLAAAGWALCRPAAASILVIEQRADAAEYQLDDSPSRFGPHAGMTGIGVRGRNPPPVRALRGLSTRPGRGRLESGVYSWCEKVAVECVWDLTASFVDT